MDPMRNYKNVSMLSHFVNDLGMIKPNRDTALTISNQKKISRLIKRARCIGLLPYCYRMVMDSSKK
jgi:ribosomal protein S18